MVHTDPQHRKKIQDCFDQFLPPFSLVEIEVRNDGDEMTGKALLSIVERKVVNGHFSASVNMLASTDSLFLDWGNLHFVDLKDFDVHFCKKASNKCSSKPRSKTLGWYHVSAFRIVTMLTACHTEWMVDAAISNFSDQLQDYMATGRGPGVAPVDDDHREERPDERSGDEERQARANLKSQPAPIYRGGPGRGSRDRGDGRKAHDEQAEAAERKKLDTAKQARESALEANRALGGGTPQLVNPPGVNLTARKDGSRPDAGGAPGFGRGPGHSFLDEIATLGSDDPYGSGGDRGQDRDRRRDRPPGGGGGHGDDRRGRDEEKGKKRKRDASSSSGRKSKVRGSAVIAPARKKDRKRRGDGGPGSDPGRGGDKKKKSCKDSRSPKKDARNKGVKLSDRKKKKVKKSNRRGRGSSSGSRSSNSQDDLYGHETSKYESLVEKAKRHPGRLLRSGLEQMSKFMAARAGSEGEPERAWRQQKVSAYLNQVLFNQHPPASIGMRNARELVTLAEGLDLLMEENFAGLGDLLMQRMKAVEASLSEGWGVANYQELIPPPKATLTTDQERAFATRHALQQRKLLLRRRRARK
eukprot:symbB.v1.2.033370.t1/scaffold4139.1/size44681/1